MASLPSMCGAARADIPLGYLCIEVVACVHGHVFTVFVILWRALRLSRHVLLCFVCQHADRTYTAWSTMFVQLVLFA